MALEWLWGVLLSLGIQAGLHWPLILTLIERYFIYEVVFRFGIVTESWVFHKVFGLLEIAFVFELWLTKLKLDLTKTEWQLKSFANVCLRCV